MLLLLLYLYRDCTATKYMCTMEQVQLQQLARELHKPVRKHFPTRKVIVSGIDHQWQADLVDMQKHKKVNKGFAWILVVIDVVSKYVWTVPLKSKNGEDVAEGLSKVLENGRKPISLQTDDGKEFYNKKVKKVLDNYGIHLFSTNTQHKACIAERFNKTLKERLWRKFTENNSYTFIHILQPIVNDYNNTVHSSIKMKPCEVNKENEGMVWDTLYGDHFDNDTKKIRFNVGTKVRISKYKTIFGKGYEGNWTEEIFVVHEVQDTLPVTYKIVDLMGDKVEGFFYNEELQKVGVQDVFRIDHVVKRQKRNGLDGYVVHWKGYPDKFDSWVSKEELKRLN